MNSENKNIDDNFRDELELLAALRRVCEIIFRAANGSRSVIRDRIADLYSREGIEYLKTGSGLEIELTKLIEVDGKRPSDQPLA
jgi:hypothetical protein